LEAPLTTVKPAEPGMFTAEPDLEPLGIFNAIKSSGAKLIESYSSSSNSAPEICESTVICNGLFAGRNQTCAMVNDTVLKLHEPAMLRVGVKNRYETNWSSVSATLVSVSNHTVVLNFSEFATTKTVRVKALRR
jgi:hypothetical protein